MSNSPIKNITIILSSVLYFTNSCLTTIRNDNKSFKVLFYFYILIIFYKVALYFKLLVLCFTLCKQICKDYIYVYNIYLVHLPMLESSLVLLTGFLHQLLILIYTFDYSIRLCRFLETQSSILLLILISCIHTSLINYTFWFSTRIQRGKNYRYLYFSGKKMIIVFQ